MYKYCTYALQITQNMTKKSTSIDVDVHVSKIIKIFKYNTVI